MTRVPPLSVAPMMDYTDRHFRYLVRRISRRTLLYTEMVHAVAVIRGDRDLLLGFDPDEHPIAVQLGGDDPVSLSEAARIAVDRGYDEVNLNVGCPSERVSSGNFGACLMRSPATVAAAVTAMKAAVPVPVTVKCRIGVDDHDRYEDLEAFATAVFAAGADRLSVHARKAWLKGLSPKENRTIPPLRYAEVYRLKAEHPEWPVEINGGITSLEAAEDHLRHVDAVMIGRAVYDQPMLLADADRRFFGDPHPPVTREQVVREMAAYAARFEGPDWPMTRITRHLLNLYTGIPGVKRWKQHLAARSAGRGAPAAVIEEALAHIAG